MRVRIVHDTVYRYDRPVKALVQALRLTPRDHDGQHVPRWRSSRASTGA
jgi:transglutaminase-like putative cysteine protease